jgi:methyl-accepting chemotaxis protein
MLLRTKIILNTVSVSVAAVILTSVIIGGSSYKKASESLSLDTNAKLDLLLNVKVDELKRYYNTITKQATSFANNLTVIQALADFNFAFYKYAQEINPQQFAYKKEDLNTFIRNYAQKYSDLNGGKIFNASKLLNKADATSFALQYNYIINNPNDIGEKNNLVNIEDASTYNRVHQKYHQLFNNYSQRFKIYDIMLVNAEGIVVYTVSKELDFTTSLVDGMYAKFEVGKIFASLMSHGDSNTAEISDYAPHLPSYDQLSAFVGSPIYQNNVKIGAIIFQLAIDDLNEIMTSGGRWQEIGLGQTGEAYLVGADKTFRSNSRFFVENKTQYLQDLEKKLDYQLFQTIKVRDSIIGLQEVDTQAVNQAFNGQKGIAQYTNYVGKPVVGSYEQINIKGLQWAIICELGVEEAFSMVKNLSSYMPLMSWIAVMLSIAISRQVTRRVSKFATSIETVVASKDLTVRISEYPDDELKAVAVSLNKLFANLQAIFQNTFNLGKQTIEHNKENLADNNYVANNNSSESLNDLTDKLNKLADQFKFFEESSEDAKDWQ